MARELAARFLDEDGPALLEIAVTPEIVATLRADEIGRLLIAGGEYRFEPGRGLQELRDAWPTLTKQVVSPC